MYDVMYVCIHISCTLYITTILIFNMHCIYVCIMYVVCVFMESERMDEWMGEWMDGWMDGHMHGCTDGWTGGKGIWCGLLCYAKSKQISQSESGWFRCKHLLVATFCPGPSITSLTAVSLCNRSSAVEASY